MTDNNIHPGSPTPPVVPDTAPTPPGPSNEPAHVQEPAIPARHGRRERSSGVAPRGAKFHGRKAKVRSSSDEAGRGRQKVMIALIPALAIALVFLLKNPLKMSSAASAQDTSLHATAEPGPTDVQIAWEIPPLYKPRGRDPMRLLSPPAMEAVEEPVPVPTQIHVQLTVTGILYSEDRPAAIVETQLVHEGQQVLGATIKRIDRNCVEFEMNGQTWQQAVNK